MRLLLTQLALAPLMWAQLSPVPSQPAQPGFARTRLSLSLKKAVEIALEPEGSARIALAEQAIKQAEARVSLARAAFMPNLDGSVQDRSQTTNLRAFGFNFQSPFAAAIPGIVGPFSVFDARASVQQTVLDFTVFRKYKVSQSGLGTAKADLDATRNQVRERVAVDYLACLRADAGLETAQANVDLSRALQALAESQKAAGTGTGIETTRAQVQLANDRQRLLVAENNFRRTVLQLLRTMGLNLDAQVDFTDKLAYQAADVADVRGLIESARKTRAEMKAQQLREETARLNVTAVKAERLPTIGSFADYGSIGSAIVGAQPTHTIGISLKVPVFDGGRRNARRGESYSQYEQEKIRSHDLGQQVELEVRLALDGLSSARSQVETAREGLTLAESELAQAQRRYQAGVANSLEVTDAQTRLDRARDNQIAALYNYNLARIELATATGTIAEYVNQ